MTDLDSPTVRFAPSPTGRLHIGNARTALFNWLVAKRAGGRFVLRYDDTDRARSTGEFADGIAEDLAWLGIAPDLVARQSERLALYDEAMARLKAAGRLYPAYETEEELDYARKRRLARGLPPVYDRAALKLTEADHARLAAEGRRPHWRFLLDHRPVAWNDLIRGPQTVDCASLSDPVLVRGDGTYLYTPTSVVDDIDLGIDLVMRGEDHVTNTAVQIQIFEALGGKAPRFAHHNLMVLPSGEGLSKRLGHLSLKSLREEGFEPLAVAIMAVRLGTDRPVEPLADLDELGGTLDLAHVSRAPARFDPAELASLNAKLLHHMPYAAVADRLAGLVDAPEAFWAAVHGNLASFSDVDLWARIIAGPVAPVIEDAACLQAAAALLPPEPWDETTWSRWTGAVKAATGAKGRALFHPLRLALTGRGDGPELAKLLPLIGRARATARLAGSSA